MLHPPQGVWSFTSFSFVWCSQGLSLSLLYSSLWTLRRNDPQVLKGSTVLADWPCLKFGDSDIHLELCFLPPRDPSAILKGLACSERKSMPKLRHKPYLLY